MLPAVLVEGLTKRFGARTAVDGLDLSVLPGEVVGFLGPNGSGKTTTVRVLLGLLRASAGTVRVLGQDPFAAAASVHAATGYVPGDVRLPPRVTAGALLQRYAALRPGPPAAGTAGLAALAERLQLDLSRPVQALSKGNRQKVALVQAFLGRPRLLVLDEPTSGLDPLGQEVFAAMVTEAARDGAAVLLSSHVLSEVEHVADRVAVLRAGRLVAVERLEVLRGAARHHVHVRVAGPASAALLADVPGAADVVVARDELRCTVPTSGLDALVKALGRARVLDVSIQDADLEELFRGYYDAPATVGGAHA